MTGAIGNPTYVVVGTINGGATPIQADVRSLGTDLPVKVTLSTDYAMLAPPGWPARPAFTGTTVRNYPHTITAGTTMAFLKAEADALVSAAAGVYA